MLDLLLIVPHPDDEAYGAGGTLAEYAATGRRAGLLTLTRGEKGRTLGLCAQDELAATRDAELRAAVAVLGLAEFRQHAYPDGGLGDVPREEVLAQVAADIRELSPRVVLTFPPDGMNRHPDHVATSEIVADALHRSGVGASLYFYATFEPRDESYRGTWRPPTHARNVAPHLAAKLTAIACHRTQAVSTVDFMRRFAGRIVTETFRRASPEWTEASLGSDLE